MGAGAGIDLDRVAVISFASAAGAAVDGPTPVGAYELAEIRKERRRVADLRAELAALQLNLEAKERDVIERIEDGAVVHGVAQVIVRRRQNISWLTVVAKELGVEAVEKVKNSWPVGLWKELQLI
jgi:hypothetical protein